MLAEPEVQLRVHRRILQGVTRRQGKRAGRRRPEAVSCRSFALARLAVTSDIYSANATVWITFSLRVISLINDRLHLTWCRPFDLAGAGRHPRVGCSQKRLEISDVTLEETLATGSARCGRLSAHHLPIWGI